MNKALSVIFPDPPPGLDPSSLDEGHIPAHVAVIMDGNGRWAKAQGKSRLAGHQAGIGAVRETIRACSDLGVGFLTIYSFSSENWKRPEEEVSGLMNLFAKTILDEVDELHVENVRVMTIGRTGDLPKKTRTAFDKAWEKTKGNTGMTLVVALNYGGRQEILDAVDRCVAEAVEEALTEAGQALGQSAGTPVSEEKFSRCLYTASLPDPDLLIRTSGELRVSNFLLWQIAYTEFYVTETLWPDFDRYELLRALLDYQGRNRRFGAV